MEKNPENLAIRVWEKVVSSRHLSIIRNALTLTLPLVIAGAFAVLINNLPIDFYQEWMTRLFGESWQSFGGYIYNGTFAVISPIIAFTIGHSIAEDYNARNTLNRIHPNIVALVSFSSLMAIIEPLTVAYSISYRWTGIHGMFLGIIIALAASHLFLHLYSVRQLRLAFFSEDADETIPYALHGLLPGLLTVAFFALIKIFAKNILGIQDLHAITYSLLYLPFKNMGNTLGTSLIYNLVRHLLWFIGIHGSNALEPIMTELYVTAINSNIAAAAAGKPIPHILTQPFFDCFISIGGAGSTLCLIIACLTYSKQGSIKRISQLSILPALFNINEIMLFGLPIILNPIFFIPFILTPLVFTLTSYAAIASGAVSPIIAKVAWTTPVFISGYEATGSIDGALLQLFNIIIGVGIYYPFVRIAERQKEKQICINYEKLLSVTNNGDTMTETAKYISRTDSVGALARSLSNDLLLSIKRNELYLEYQPQVDAITGKVFGAEALVRWKHPHIGKIPPSLFIALAEDIGFISTIGLWVCDEASRQMSEWRKAGVNNFVMSINVSMKQLDDPNLPEKLSASIRQYDVPPEFMEIEVTESVGLSSHLGHNVLLQDIRLRGIQIAIDDFGMGHSSLVYLKQFPVNTLKLDRVLVHDVHRNRSSAEIIATISELCRSLDVHLLAEYVETKEQALILQELGCHRFQGYLYSPSLAPDECLRVIQKGFPLLGR